MTTEILLDDLKCIFNNHIFVYYNTEDMIKCYTRIPNNNMRYICSISINDYNVEIYPNFLMSFLTIKYPIESPNCINLLYYKIDELTSIFIQYHSRRHSDLYINGI